MVSSKDAAIHKNYMECTAIKRSICSICFSPDFGISQLIIQLVDNIVMGI